MYFESNTNQIKIVSPLIQNLWELQSNERNPNFKQFSINRVIEYAQIEIEIGIEFMISFGEIIQLA